MSAWKRQGDNVVLTLTEDQWAGILVALGIAAGSFHNDNLAFRRWIKLANEINAGNPDFIPYALAEGVTGGAKT